jgi:hypothetical protein
VPLAQARTKARRLLGQVLSDRYLVKSVGRALVRRLKREQKRAERETTFSPATATRLVEAELRPDWELGWDIEQATASFLQRPGASELDRKLVAALRSWPDRRADPDGAVSLAQAAGAREETAGKLRIADANLAHVAPPPPFV